MGEGQGEGELMPPLEFLSHVGERKMEERKDVW
jgi:hypothetical protein